jgi:hypothetical protein
MRRLAISLWCVSLSGVTLVTVDVSVLAIMRDCPGTSAGQSIGSMMGNDCPGEVARAARRTAALTRLTTARQMRALEDVIRAMSTATGLKHLVLLTNGLGVTRDLSGLEPVARAAATAGVQMSILVEDPAGIDMTDTGPLTEAPGAPEPMLQKMRRDDGFTLVNGMQTVPVEDQLRAPIGNGTSRYGVPISPATALRHTPGTTQVDLGMNISMPSTVSGPLTTMFALVDGTGAVKSGRKVMDAPVPDDVRVTGLRRIF